MTAPVSSIEAKFLSESDQIERINNKPISFDRRIRALRGGEKPHYYMDHHATAYFYVIDNCYDRLPTIGDILEIHRLLTFGQEQITPGRFRTSWVSIGGHLAPDANKVPYMVDELVHRIKQDPFNELKHHADYEMIHPFFDGNGRSGRLLWLWLWLGNAKPFEKTFLKQYFKGRSFRERQLEYYRYLNDYRKERESIHI